MNTFLIKSGDKNDNKKENSSYCFCKYCSMLTFIITAAGSSRSIFASSTSNGIIIHYKDEYENPKIYYWNSLPKNLEVDWPGKKMKSEDNGWFTDAITGNKAVVSDGTLTTDAISKPNMRIYVLDTSKTKAPGKLSGYSPYLK